MIMQPTVKEAYWAMGRLFSQREKWVGAEKAISQLLRIERDDFNRPIWVWPPALPHLGRTGRSVIQLKEALRTCPDAPGYMNNLAWTLATSGEAELRDGAQAVKYAEQACELTHYPGDRSDGPRWRAAYAEAGRF